MAVLETTWRLDEAPGLLGYCNQMITAQRELGHDVSEAERLALEAAQALEAERPERTVRLVAQARAALRSSPPLPDWPYVEPTDLEGIKAEMPTVRPPVVICEGDATRDRIHGGWLGKNIGGALGGPIEGWTRERIAEAYGEISDYVQKPPSTLNDDTAYEIVALHVVEDKGRDFTATDIGLEWVERIPQSYTAERVAIENLRRGLMPPECALVDNPYREWIGGQMKGEVWGLLCPGRPADAVEYAYRDAIVAHERNGVYGELYDAALIATAFVERNPRTLLESCLGFVPARSRFAEVVRDSIRWCDESGSWLEAWEKAEASHAGRYHPDHTFPAICAVVIGLLFGEGDFEHSTCITASCGLDTDCSAGQTAAIMGTVLGASGIPEKWKGPLGDDFETFVVGYERLKTSEVAEWTCRLSQKLA
ncbi:MAG: ADP-ribosylglycohydrolase family protein [Armatimonadota bacterium]|nr:MAG: ADP-ribosylglycohydrolase family protein [Armatimonadota bacterium]